MVLCVNMQVAVHAEIADAVSRIDLIGLIILIDLKFFRSIRLI